MDIINLPKEYQYVNNIRYSCQYHVIFCPKYRRKVLVNGVDECLLQLLHEKQDEFGYKLYSTEPPKYTATTLTAVPYYLWANRAPGEMTVWIN